MGDWISMGQKPITVMTVGIMVVIMMFFVFATLNAFVLMFCGYALSAKSDNPSDSNTEILDTLRNGNSFYDAADYVQAIAYYDKVLSIDRENFDATYNKALALDKLKRYAEAIDYYDRALALNSSKVAEMYYLDKIP